MTLNPVKLLGPPFFPLSTGRRGPFRPVQAKGCFGSFKSLSFFMRFEGVDFFFLTLFVVSSCALSECSVPRPLLRQCRPKEAGLSVPRTNLGDLTMRYSKRCIGIRCTLSFPPNPKLKTPQNPEPKSQLSTQKVDGRGRTRLENRNAHLSS